jgi:uncharacterized SAM-binding protein YcdF (DUF218 family)
MFRQLFEVLVLPPASAIALFGLAMLVKLRRPGLGRLLAGLAIAWLWLASTPFVGGLLLCSLQRYPALSPTGPLPDAQAIVVLAAGADRVGAEYGRPVIGPMTLRRLRYAAALQRRTGLPMLVSGGRPAADAPSLAEMMARTAAEELRPPLERAARHLPRHARVGRPDRLRADAVALGRSAPGRLISGSHSLLRAAVTRIIMRLLRMNMHA